MKKLFNRSIQGHKRIMIFYVDNNNKVTQRVIRVIRVGEDAIVAYCYYRNKIRTFKLNNILSVGLPGKKVGA